MALFHDLTIHTDKWERFTTWISSGRNHGRPCLCRSPCNCLFEWEYWPYCWQSHCMQDRLTGYKRSAEWQVAKKGVAFSLLQT